MHLPYYQRFNLSTLLCTAIAGTRHDDREWEERLYDAINDHLNAYDEVKADLYASIVEAIPLTFAPTSYVVGQIVERKFG